MKKHALALSLLLLAGTQLGGCDKPVLSEEVADRIASPAWMVERTVPAGPFALNAFERMHTRHAPANVYIEGDGKAWVSRKQVSLDPTPVNPMALHLASKDAAENVVYLARPCQFTKLQDKDKPCDPVYWTSRRFSEEVLDAYNAALDEIKQRYDIESFNLVGFSGGAAIAAILAAQRDDVLTVRTVAGNLDHKAHSAIQDVSFLQGSLNPPDFAGRLRTIPQIHFIGGQDQVVPPAILQSYLQAVGPSNCVQYKLIQEADHEVGWVDKWPELLAIKPACAGPVQQTVIELPPEPEVHYTTPESLEKP
jgi:dienelactone hydrolase